MRADLYLEKLRACPMVTVTELTGNQAFVVLSPHPDDETLGTGGLIATARAAGFEVAVIIVSDGSGSHPRSKEYPQQKLIDLRYSEVHNAGLALGLSPDQVSFLGLPDTAVPTSGPMFDAAAEQVLAVIRQSNAKSLFVTWEYDPHCDHEASAALAREVQKRNPDLKLWAYPVWGWHLPPDKEIDAAAQIAVRIDISEHRQKKSAAIDAHASQMTDLIKDDPDGFRFDQSSLAPFLSSFEYFIEVTE